MKRIGEYLRIARENAGMTQQDVARRVNVSAAYISQVESGRRADPQFTTVAKICIALNLPLDDLLVDIGLKPGKRARSASSSGGKKTLRKLVRQLDATAQALKHLVDQDD